MVDALGSGSWSLSSTLARSAPRARLRIGVDFTLPTLAFGLLALLSMTRSRVAVLKTTPAMVVEDYKRLMRLANYENFLPRDKQIALKINISWHYFYPACSTTPWQLDG
jgi:hypothetical protein